MKFFRIFILSLLTLILFAGMAYATPSTTFWTPMVMDFQPFGVPHLGIDNYFTVGKKATNPSNNVPSFPTDFTIPEIGVLPFDKIQMEVGVDYLAPSDYPWFFNGKIGSPEDSYFKGQPALEIGVFNAGTKTASSARADHSNAAATTYDVLYGVIGKTIDPIGRITAGPYYGNPSALVSSTGKHENTGIMVAFDHGFAPVKDDKGNVLYNKWVFAADYASGKNYIGGGGFGMYYYFNADISLLTGPVWFNDQGINGRFKWTTQLDVNLPKWLGL